MAEDKKYIELGARLPVDLSQKVKEKAKKIGISQNSIIVLALNKYLEQQS